MIQLSVHAFLYCLILSGLVSGFFLFVHPELYESADVKGFRRTLSLILSIGIGIFLAPIDQVFMSVLPGFFGLWTGEYCPRFLERLLK